MRSTTFFTKPLLPIHLIWIDGKLREKDVPKPILWKKLNPLRVVYVWVEAEHLDEVKTQLTGQAIQVGNLSEIKIPTDIRNIITKLTAPREDKLVSNPAASSDFCRYYLLKQFGGLYTDFDKVPFAIDEEKVSHIFNFKLRNKSTRAGAKFPPDLIFSTLESLFIQNAVTYLEKLATLINEEVIQNIRSNNLGIRISATINTTGSIVEAALATISWEGSPIFDLKTRAINEEVFSTLLTTSGGDVFENSWLKIPGIVKDDPSVTKEQKLFLQTLKQKSLKTGLEVATDYTDSIRAPEWMSLFKSFMKTTSIGDESKVMDCLEEYFWKPTPLFY